MYVDMQIKVGAFFKLISLGYYATQRHCLSVFWETTDDRQNVAKTTQTVRVQTWANGFLLLLSKISLVWGGKSMRKPVKLKHIFLQEMLLWWKHHNCLQTKALEVGPFFCQASWHLRVEQTKHASMYTARYIPSPHIPLLKKIKFAGTIKMNCFYRLQQDTDAWSHTQVHCRTESIFQEAYAVKFGRHSVRQCTNTWHSASIVG